MELMPGYKQTEVGVIPEDWEVQAFKDGYAESSRNGIYKPAEYQGRGTRIVNMGELFALDFISDQEMALVELSPAEASASTLRDGDLLFGRRSVVPSGAGKCSLIVKPSTPLTFESSVIRVRLHEKSLSPLFYYYFFSSPIGKRIMAGIVSGTNVKGIRASELRELKIPRPPLSDQREVEQALNDIDGLIAMLNRQITKKRQIKQAAMQELLTGKRRLPGFEGEWEVERLGELCSMKSGEGITAKSIDAVSPFPCYGGNGQRGFTTRFTHEGDYCLIGRVGALCGNLLKVSGQFFASEHAIVVRAFENVDVAWLTLALGTLNLNRRAESSAQPVLTVSKLLPLEVNVPSSKQEQTTIATVLSDMDAELASLEARLDKARELKQGMMQQLLTGKIRLT